VINPARRNARERALELLYEAEIKSLDVSTVLGALPVAPDPFALALVRGVESNQAEHDEIIVAHLKAGWALNRLPTIDRLVLRLGIEELTRHSDVPTAVILDEAVRLAKGFSTDDSGRFVNGVLAAIARTVKHGEVEDLADHDLGELTESELEEDHEPPIVKLKEGETPTGVSFEDEPATSLDS
jgi:transcription antitermination protein NusB